MQITDGKSDFEEIKVKGRLYIRETCGADAAQRTKESPFITTGIRRAMLNKQPDD